MATHNGAEIETGPSYDGPPEIPSNEIIFDKTRDFLGEGAFGKVYKGRCRGKDVAVKVPIKQNLTNHELDAFRHEVQMMRKIFHPNVVLFLGACTAENNVMIVTELMETDLEKLIHSSHFSAFSLLARIKLAKDAALGINWLHGINKIVHRDLKPANLLIDNNKTVKVTDFGFSQLKRPNEFLRDKVGPIGTALYMAPEVMMQGNVNEKADVYSFGLILYELLTGEELFPNFEEWDEFYEAICVKHVRPSIPKTTPHSLETIIIKCWSFSPDDRLSFREIVYSLDNLLVELYLPIGEGRVQQDVEEGRKFWITHFLQPQQALQEMVTWREFQRVLNQLVKVTASQMNALKSLIANTVSEDAHEDKLAVTLDKFSRVLTWFGCFFLPDRANNIFTEIEMLQTSGWFHGDISKDLAEKRLFNRAPGTWLLRFSSSTDPSYPYAISKIIPDKTYQHKRIRHLENGSGYNVPVKGANRTFKSIFELVQCPDLGLQIPCPKDILQFNPYLEAGDDND